MNKYAANFPASTEKEYLRARERLVRLQIRLRDAIRALAFTKAGAPRKRVDQDALHAARSKKYQVERLIRDLDAWWAAELRKKAAAKKKKKAPEKQTQSRPSKVSSNKKQQKEIERLQRENEKLRADERRRKEDRKREREEREEAREEAMRQEFILSGDYQGLAELEGISDSEAYTEILYAQMEMGAAGVAA